MAFVGLSVKCARDRGA